MNKIAFYLLLILTVFSCNDEKIDDVYKDYRFETKVIQASEQDLQTACINAAVDFSIKIEKRDSRIGNYNFAYSQLQGEGILFYRDTILPPGVEITCNETELPLKFIPTSKGNFYLKFTFQNDLVNVTDKLTGKAENEYFSIRAKNLPSKLLIDNPFTFDLELNAPNGKNEKFLTNTSVTEGGGKITIINQEVVDSSSSPKSYLLAGNNKISYVSKTHGQNTLNFNICNQYGFTQLMSLPLNIELPDFELQLVCDTVVETGISNFLLRIKEIEQHINNRYFATYRWLSNNGKLRINDSEITTGGVLELKSGDNIGQVSPQSLGDASLEILVRDQYNSSKKDTLMFGVVKSVTDINVSNYTGQATVFDQQSFNFAVFHKTYSGKYQFEIIPEPTDVELLVNGIRYTGGKQLLANRDNTLVSFIPKKVGILKLKLKIYDEYNSISVKELPFEVSNSNGRINISNHNPSINLLSATSFNFSVTKPNYSKGFKFEITKNPVQSGTLKVNGKDYSGGKIIVENPDNTIVSYAPTVLGDITLSIAVWDDFEGKIIKDIPFIVNNTSINLSVNSVEKELIVGKETYFNFTADKQFFDGNLNYSLNIEPVAGTLKVNGESYIPNFTNAKIPNHSTATVAFLPTQEGNATLTVSVWDDYLGTKRYPVVFSITNPPINIETKNFDERAIINTANKFTFSLSKQNYKGKYKCQLEMVPATAGQMKINDIVYEGNEVELTNGNNTQVSFTPSRQGKVVLKMTITDELKGKVKKEFTFNVENPDLQVVLANVDDELTLNKRTTFNFSINKPGYKGKFYYEISSENCSDIKVANVMYATGERNEVPSPQGTTVSFVPIVVGSDTVCLNMRFFDEWGGFVEKKLSFSVSNSDIELIVNNESQIYVNKASVLSIEANKPNYKGKLKFEIAATPNNGTFTIDGESCTSGWRDFDPGSPVEILYMPKIAGIVNVKITVTDKFGGIKSRTFNFNVNNPEPKLEISNFIASSILNTENVFNFSVKKEFYTGIFYCNLVSEPLQAGTFKIDGQIYNGGNMELKNPNNTRITFMPNIVGNVVLSLTILDETGSEVKRKLNYDVVDFPIQMSVSNQATGLTIDQPSSFNFAVSKKGYEGKFYYEITSEPVVAGKIKINDVAYQGGKTLIANPTNTKVTFIPSVRGDVNLILKVSDERENEIFKQLHFSVQNSDFKIVVSNLEKDILLGKPTSFNLSCIKNNYSGSYKFEIEATPDNIGNILVNGSAYQGGKQSLVSPVNSIIQLTSFVPGVNSLLIRIFDENGGSSQEIVTYNCVNPPININVTGKEESILYNTPSTFNVSATKEFYTGQFNIQVFTLPVNSVGMKIDNTVYFGGIQPMVNPNNCQITITPKISNIDDVKIIVVVTDNVNGKTEKTLNFNIENPEIELNVVNYTSDITVHAPTTFNFTVGKKNYPGKFMYQITQVPAEAGVVEVNGVVYNGSRLTVDSPNSNLVKFTPNKIGSATLHLNVVDEWGKEQNKMIAYSIANSDIQVNVSNQEGFLLRNKPTSFTFSVTKPNYTGNFDAELISEPNIIRDLKLNGTAYSSGIIPIKASGNLVEFTPDQAGSLLLKLRIGDDLNGDKERVLNFDVKNSPLILEINNKSNVINVGSTAKFTIKADKDNYDGVFKYEVTPYPYSGNVSVGGIVGLSGNIGKHITEVTYTPEVSGSVALKIKITDAWGGEIEKQINFTVNNTPINININIKDSEDNVIINQPTVFSFTVNKVDYTDNKNIYYSLFPINRGKIMVNGQNYSGGAQQIKYSDAKKGTVVSYTPDREGDSELTILVTDEYNQTKQVSVNFNVSNPDLNLAITGANETGNSANLNETYKFFFNASKQYYNHDFAYWITTDPVDAALVAVSDVTPRGRAADGSGTATGTITNSAYGNATAEVRFTPNNSNYLNRPVNVNIKIKDKWNNERNKTIQFTPTTSAISVNVVRNLTSIPVEKQYLFYFTVSKPGYSGNFKYAIIGQNDDDVLEIGAAISNLVGYNGGKFDVPSIDHTYIRYTPGTVGTVPLKLIVYDINNSYVEKDVAFDVKAPSINLSGGGIKGGMINEYIPFSILATEDNGNSMNMSIEVDPSLNGVVLFNKENVYSGNRAASNVAKSISVESGKNNSLEIMSRLKGSYSTEMRLSNIWNSTANVDAIVNVSEPIYYSLTVTKNGEGQVPVSPQTDKYQPGTTVQITVNANDGWQFIRWEGDLTGSDKSQTLIMTSNKNVKAVFEKNPTEKVKIICNAVILNVTPPESVRDALTYSLNITETQSGKPIFSSSVIYPMNPSYNFETDIDKTLEYTLTVELKAKSWTDNILHRLYTPQDLLFDFKFADGSKGGEVGHVTPFKKAYIVKGSAFIGSGKNELLGKAMYTYSTSN